MRFSWHVQRRNEQGQNLRGIGSFGHRSDGIDVALKEAFESVRKEVCSDSFLNRKARIKIEIELDTTGAG
ncbi:MAG: hypothetical protein E5V74_01735 [Mesorhizobium sp.]|nr:MAG: hypothetical protein E5V74_01735 [Mesorhizobium sp.]